MYQRKLCDYGRHLPALRDNGIEYRPVIFSCYGRIHPEAQHIFRNVLLQIRQRRGVVDDRALHRRFRRNVAVRIWQRAARMVKCCLPSLSDEEAAVLLDAGGLPAAAADVLG